MALHVANCPMTNEGAQHSEDATCVCHSWGDDGARTYIEGGGGIQVFKVEALPKMAKPPSECPECEAPLVYSDTPGRWECGSHMRLDGVIMQTSYCLHGERLVSERNEAMRERSILRDTLRLGKKYAGNANCGMPGSTNDLNEWMNEVDRVLGDEEGLSDVLACKGCGNIHCSECSDEHHD